MAHGRTIIEWMDARIHSSSTMNEWTPTRMISIDNHPNHRHYDSTHRGEYATHSRLTNKSSSRVLHFPKYDVGMGHSVSQQSDNKSCSSSCTPSHTSSCTSTCATPERPVM